MYSLFPKTGLDSQFVFPGHQIVPLRRRVMAVVLQHVKYILLPTNIQWAKSSIKGSEIRLMSEHKENKKFSLCHCYPFRILMRTLPNDTCEYFCKASFIQRLITKEVVTTSTIGFWHFEDCVSIWTTAKLLLWRQK